MAEQSPAPRRRQVPTWYYAVGAAGVAVVFFLYRRSQANKVAAAPSTTANTTPVPAQPAVSGQDLGTLLGYITQAQGAPAQVVTTPTTTSTTSTPNFATAVGTGQAGGQLLDIVGSIVAPSTYSGYNVTGGAPVYANIGGQWKLGVPAAQLPVGTQLATPVASAGNINTAAGVVTEKLG